MARGCQCNTEQHHTLSLAVGDKTQKTSITIITTTTINTVTINIIINNKDEEQLG